MSYIGLFDHQRTAIDQMKNGCILCGGVGTGKSRTALGYYYQLQGGNLDSEIYTPMQSPKDLYIITTARKRDSAEWLGDMIPFGITTNPDIALYGHTVVVDSWNNIAKYRDIHGAFFIFDEQRVVGSGSWVKAFLDIARKNSWVLLSATPGDTWMDYVPVFVANGFYKNRTEFIHKHVVYRWVNKTYPKIDRYLDVDTLIKHRDELLVDMVFSRPTIPHHNYLDCDYDRVFYKECTRDRWDPYENMPMANASALCAVQRRIVNSDESRQVKLLELFEDHPKLIVFYNFNYELDILREILTQSKVTFSEWNGQLHQPYPTGKRWIYLVQYNAGNEAWNCVETDTIVFYSLSYSYRIMTQAAGRIDRLNTKFVDLHYFYFMSKGSIDSAIKHALDTKEDFNERKYESSFDRFAE